MGALQSSFHWPPSNAYLTQLSSPVTVIGWLYSTSASPVVGVAFRTRTPVTLTEAGGTPRSCCSAAFRDGVSVAQSLSLGGAGSVPGEVVSVPMHPGS